MQLTDFSKRLIATAIASSLLILLFSFAFTFLGKWLLFLTVAVLVIVGGYEYVTFAKKKEISIFFPLLAIGSFFVLLSFFTASFSPLWPIVVTLFSFMAIHLQNPKGSLVDLAVSSFPLFYIAVPMGMLLSILFHPLQPGLGMSFVLYLLFVTKGTDVGAYLGGKLLGKHKLIPKVSPGKTVEGTLCGVTFTVLISFFFMKWTLLPLGSWNWLWLGILFAIVSQFGDLVESLLKRDVGMKDSNALPGFGGVLDMIDSLLCTTPLLYLIQGLLA